MKRARSILGLMDRLDYPPIRPPTTAGVGKTFALQPVVRGVVAETRPGARFREQRFVSTSSSFKLPIEVLDAGQAEEALGR
jgi:hypothetical protein